MSLRPDGTPGPDLIVIGAMKAGTTTLARHLAAHPMIGLSRDKETDYFIAEKNWRRGSRWYAGQFAPGLALHAEASPNYAKRDDFPGVPERIAAHDPAMRLVFLARDPVERAISQYRHSWTMGDIAMSPADLPGTHEWTHILNASRYAHQIDAYLDHFPRGQLLVLDFTELVRAPERAMARVADHLGIPPGPLADAASHNENAEVARIPAPLLRLAQSPLGRATSRIVSRGARDRARALLARGERRDPGPMPDDARERMREALAEDAARFRTLSGLPFDDWSV